MPGAAGGQEGCLLGKTHGVGGDARAAEGRPHGERAAGAWAVHLRDFNAITSSWLRVGQTPAPPSPHWALERRVNTHENPHPHLCMLVPVFGLEA